MDSVPLRRIIQKFRFIMGACIKSTGLQKTDISKLRIAKVNKQLNKYHNAHGTVIETTKIQEKKKKKSHPYDIYRAQIS